MKRIIIVLLFSFNIHIIFSQENIDLMSLYTNFQNRYLELLNEGIEVFSNNSYTMDNEYYVIDSFGFGQNPFTGYPWFCDYITILVYSTGENVYSISEGEVIEIGWDQEFRNYIKIKYSDFEIEYGNLMNIKIEIGDKINIGQLIGEIGPSFGSRGVGIHLRIKYKNIPLDPYLLIKFDRKRRH
jgi:murein DD-endopeptidase MepM/ murein hydrolase activator NlpD